MAYLYVLSKTYDIMSRVTTDGVGLAIGFIAHLQLGISRNYNGVQPHYFFHLVTASTSRCLVKVF
jgi:hypothetical protein